MSVTHALKWSFLAELASKAVAPIVFIILARLLTPEDFGVMTAALMVIGFSQIFWEAGMGKALIQRQTDIDDAANVAFWINIGLGLVIAGLLFFAAQPIAQTFFHDDRVSTVIKVMTLQIFLGATSSVHSALLQKNMEFKKLFWVRFSTVTLPGIASIPLAQNGMGYWALVVGALAGQCVQMILLWQISPWRPNIKFNVPIASSLIKFGAWICLTSVSSWFYLWMDSLIVGITFGLLLLGSYKLAEQIVSLLNNLFFSSITPVIYSKFSLEPNLTTNKQFIISVINLCVGVSFLANMSVIIFFDSIQPYVFTKQWDNITPFVSTFALTFIFSSFVLIQLELYKAINRPDIESKLAVLPIPLYFIIYYLTAKQGLDIFLYARIIAPLTMMLVNIFILSRVISIEIKKFRTSYFIVAYSIFLFFVNLKFANGIIDMLLHLLACCLIFYFCLIPSLKTIKTVLTTIKEN